MIQGFIGTHNPNKPDRLAVLKAIGGVLSPDGGFIFLPGEELPKCLQHLADEWQPVPQVPEWAK